MVEVRVVNKDLNALGRLTALIMQLGASLTWRFLALNEPPADTFEVRTLPPAIIKATLFSL